MRIAVLVKQVPRFDGMELGSDGRLRREGVELELNPYCRRAVSKATELARRGGGTVTVLTLGPPSAEDCLREAIAWGADDGVLLTDPAHAGSDTLATARSLAAGLRRIGPVDLVLCGRNSVDADTGQVGPAVAELLDLAFAGPARQLDVVGDRLTVRCELDDGFATAALRLPAVVACAERLCEPAKVDPAGRAAVDPRRIRRLGAGDLGAGPFGQAGSPTWVGRVRTLETPRLRLRLDGPIEAQVERALAVLDERGALDGAAAAPLAAHLPPPARPEGAVVAAVADPERGALSRELCTAAARLAAAIGGSACLVATVALAPGEAASIGADGVVLLDGVHAAEDAAAGLTGWARRTVPWAILLPGTGWGREVAARSAAALGAGLVGDAVELDVEAGRLVAWKPAFGGRLVAAVTATSPIQMVTVRPGVLPAPPPRPATPIDVSVVTVSPRGRVAIGERVLDDDLEALATAQTVLGVGSGIAPDEYADLERLRRLLGAELACTRKVTDRGWLPRSRQVGITGRSIAPRLYVSLAAAGKFNHVVGFRGATTVLAINRDPEALVFESCDVGIVSSWQEAVGALGTALAGRLATGV